MATALPERFADEWLSMEQSAEFFGCSLGAMKKRLQVGGIPYRVFWHKRYVHRADLTRFFRSWRYSARTAPPGEQAVNSEVVQRYPY